MFYPILIRDFYQTYQPRTKAYLNLYKKWASKIPDQRLKHEALTSLSQKSFHCYGASFYAALVSNTNYNEYLKFMTAYQSMCDYLDNLVDQTSMINETNFRRLHQSLLDVFTLTKTLPNYYQYQTEQQDGGYLNMLVRLCQEVLRKIPHYEIYQGDLLQLAQLYVDLQVYKHLHLDKRESRLIEFNANYQQTLSSNLSWYEFSAACGSTLGIFTMVAYALNQPSYLVSPNRIFKATFPDVQELHIMLDYLIDFQEDMVEQELNFFSYYPTFDDGIESILKMYKRAQKAVRSLPEASFHQTINDGLFALYLAEGMRKGAISSKTKRMLMKHLGFRARFLLFHTKRFVK